MDIYLHITETVTEEGPSYRRGSSNTRQLTVRTPVWNTGNIGRYLTCKSRPTKYRGRQIDR